MIHRALFSSQKSDWATPLDLFLRLDREFHFDIDVCATEENHKCARYWTPHDNGLKQPWSGTCWMNPPYGRAVAEWVKKAFNESVAGARVVSLLPVRTDTRWWQNWVLKAREIRFLRGRVRFVGADSVAPFPSAVAIFDPRQEPQLLVRGWAWKTPLSLQQPRNPFEASA